MTERWLPVVGYEGWYEVSSLARVRRVRKGKGTQVGFILKEHENNYGRMYLRLSRFGKRKFVFVHRLVAEAFIGPRPEGKEVNHKDGIPRNNSPENLEYLTRSENLQHACSTGLRPRVKLTPTKVRRLRKLRGTMTNMQLAEEFGVSLSAIQDVLYHGKWSYVE